MSEAPRQRWRVALHFDHQDAVEKALRHRRFDLFYGPHYLRYTRTRGDDGTVRLRLEERARLVGGHGNGETLLTAERLPHTFAYEESVSRDTAARGGAETRDQVFLETARRFFGRGARLLERYDHPAAGTGQKAR